MTQYDSRQVAAAVSDLEALREFSPPPDPHKLKLDRVIDRLQRLLKSKETATA